MAEILYIRPDQAPRRDRYTTEEEYIRAVEEHDRGFIEYAYKVQRDFPDMIQGQVEYKKMENMKVKYIGNSALYYLLPGKIYTVLFIVEGYYLIIDENNEDHLYPAEVFEIIENGNAV